MRYFVSVTGVVFSDMFFFSITCNDILWWKIWRQIVKWLWECLWRTVLMLGALRSWGGLSFTSWGNIVRLECKPMGYECSVVTELICKRLWQCGGDWIWDTLNLSTAWRRWQSRWEQLVKWYLVVGFSREKINEHKSRRALRSWGRGN